MTWDVTNSLYPTPAGTFSIYFNGGYIVTSSSNAFDQILSSTVVETRPVTGTNVSTTNTNPIGGGAYATWNAAVGGTTLPDGLAATASATVSYNLTGILGIQDGHQQMQSQLWRTFDPADGGQVTVAASLDGLINWPLSPNDQDFWSGLYTDSRHPSEFEAFYHGYNLIATVFVQSAQIGLTGVGFVDSFTLNKNGNILSDSIIFTPDPDSYYILAIALYLESSLQNAVFPFGENTGILPDSPLWIGEIQLNATVTQSPVPIPGSLVLLASGIVGLVAVKRRKRQE
jgi:hypothetical protein